MARFGKLPMPFGFAIPYTDTRGNLPHYYPDFVVVDQNGTHYLVETKGREDIEVLNKDRAATLWVKSASELTGKQWQCVKVLQKQFHKLGPTTFADCVYMGAMQPDLFDE